MPQQNLSNNNPNFGYRRRVAPVPDGDDEVPLPYRVVDAAALAEVRGTLTAGVFSGDRYFVFHAECRFAT